MTVSDASNPDSRVPGQRPARDIVILALVWLGLFVLRLTGPSDILDKDQLLNASYILDAVQNGNWICQHDVGGNIASKPPLYNWAVAIMMSPSTRLTRFLLYLPTGLAALVMCWAILLVGRAQWGARAGLFAALVFLVSTPTVKLMALARTDCFYGVTSALAAFAAFRAWRLGRGWTWFWLAAGAATLTKGPLGAVLAAGGLLAAQWERRSGTPAPVLGRQARGIALFLLITLGWFGLAYHQEGWPLFQKLIKSELLYHIYHRVAGPFGRVPGGGFYKPPFFFLTYYAPGSLVALLGFWRVWRSVPLVFLPHRPASRPALRPAVRPADGAKKVVASNQCHIDEWERRFERFLFCWFFFGMVLFMLPTHQRRDLIFPIYPAAALIAGRELERLAARARPAVAAWAAAATVAVSFVIFFLVYHVWTAPLVVAPKILTETHDLEELARTLRHNVGRAFPITHADCHYGLQYYLNTMRPRVSFEEAAALLRGDAAAYVAVHDLQALKARMPPGGPELHVVASYPPMRDPYASIVSNRPQLQWSDCMAMLSGPVLVRMERLRLSQMAGGVFVFEAGPDGGSVEFANHSDVPRLVRMRIMQPGRQTAQNKELAPGDVWRVTAVRGR